MKLYHLTSPTANCQVKGTQCTTRDNRSLGTMRKKIGLYGYLTSKPITIFMHEFDSKHNKSFRLRKDRKGVPILCETLIKENGEPLNILMCS